MGAFSIWHWVIVLLIPIIIILLFIWKKGTKNHVNKYDQNNRLTRGEYAIRIIPIIVVNSFVGNLMEGTQVLFVISIILSIILLIYSIQITIKRFHDINMSGWYTFLIIIPFTFLILFFIPGTPGDLNVSDKVKD